MSSIRLTNEIREIIAKRLYNDYFKKNIQPKIDIASVEISKIFWDIVPDEVKNFYEKFPRFTSVNTSHTICACYFSDEESRSYTYGAYIPIAKLFKGCFTDEDYSSDKNLVKFIKSKNKKAAQHGLEIYEEYKKARQLKKKIECILSHISTANKLKDEFPEAYECYFGANVDNTEKENSNMCDSIENLRAELSK